MRRALSVVHGDRWEASRAARPEWQKQRDEEVEDFGTWLACAGELFEIDETIRALEGALYRIRLRREEIQRTHDEASARLDARDRA